MDFTRINSLNELEKLLELLARFDICEFEVEADNRKMKFAKSRPNESASAPVTFVSGAPAAGAPLAEAPRAAAHASPTAGDAPAGPPDGVEVITSPMVGTFYAASSPEADPFVQIGDRVEDDTVLCIIEAMKVMNEIPAGRSGVIKEILVQNGESVEFGQPLFHLG